jgi:hypothetical protein
MATLPFPFCIITSRHADISLPVVPTDAMGYVAAFSTVEKATAYMQAMDQKNWQLRLVSRPTLDVLVTTLRALGVKGFSLDPSDNPHKIDLDEI